MSQVVLHKPVVTIGPAPNAIGYIRVSTEDQAREHKTSLTDQRAAITLLAQQLGVMIGPVFEDPGFSGSTADQRPGFMALLAFCQAHPRSARSPGYVLALNDSRWGRFPDPEDATFYRMECKHHGWVVRFAEGDDVQDPMARIVLRGIHSAQASAYRETLKANTVRGMSGAAAQGFWLCEAPYGYRRLAEGAGRPAVLLDRGVRKADDQRVKLTPGPADERMAVLWAFTTYAAGGLGLEAIAEELRRRDPVRKWSKTQVGKLLKSRTYLGEVIWQRAGDHAAVITPDAHPALISTALFDSVQLRLAGNHKCTRATAGRYPLSGLIRCLQCGETYTGGGGPKGPAHDPDRYRFYKDRGGTDFYRKCAGHLGTLQARWVEPVVIRTIASIVRQPAVQRLIQEAIDRRLGTAVEDEPARRRQLESEGDQVQAARQRILRAIGRGIVQEREAATELERLRQEEARLTVAREQQRFAHSRLEGADTERARLLALALDFEAQAAHLSGVALRELIAPWLESAVVDKRNRELRLTIRRVPGMTVLLQSDTAGARD